jgi:glycosyltransferase involved in cell wall biosynthesis
MEHALDPQISGRRPSDRRLTGVCLLSGEYPPDAGGVGDYTSRLAAALASLSIPVGVLTRVPRHLSLFTLHPSVPVHRWIRAWDFRAWPTIVRAVQSLGARPLLHIQYQAGAYDLKGVVNLLPLWVRRVVPRARVVTTFHDMREPYIFPKAGPLRPFVNQRLARDSHAAIFAEAVDQAAAGPGVNGYLVPIGSNVDRAPPPGFDRRAERRRLGADDDTCLVGYFGFLNATKGVRTLLEAIATLVTRDRPARLVLIGGEVGASDPTDLAHACEVHQAIGNLGLEDRVSLTGFLPPPETSAALLACDLIALPFRDGASLRRGTLMAAFSHGLPIVSTRGPGSTSGPIVLEDEKQLVLVPPDDPVALAAAIGRVADDAALRAHLSAGAEAIARQIAWTRIAARTLEIYEATFAATKDEGRKTKDGAVSC